MSLRKKDKKKRKGDTYNLQSLRTAFAFKKLFFQFLIIITAKSYNKTQYFHLLLSIQFTIKMPTIYLETQRNITLHD